MDVEDRLSGTLTVVLDYPKSAFGKTFLAGKFSSNPEQMANPRGIALGNIETVGKMAFRDQ